MLRYVWGSRPVVIAGESLSETRGSTPAAIHSHLPGRAGIQKSFGRASIFERPRDAGKHGMRKLRYEPGKFRNDELFGNEFSIFCIGSTMLLYGVVADPLEVVETQNTGRNTLRTNVTVTVYSEKFRLYLPPCTARQDDFATSAEYHDHAASPLFGWTAHCFSRGDDRFRLDPRETNKFAPNLSHLFAARPCRRVRRDGFR